MSTNKVVPVSFLLLLLLLFWFFVLSLSTQARVVLKEGTTTERMPPEVWSAGKSEGHFLD